MRHDHLPAHLRLLHPKGDRVVEDRRLAAFRHWTRENFDREPTRDEIAQFMKGSK